MKKVKQILLSIFKILLSIFIFLFISQFLVIVDMALDDIRDVEDFTAVFNFFYQDQFFKHYFVIPGEYKFEYYDYRYNSKFSINYTYHLWQFVSSIFLTYFFVFFDKSRWNISDNIPHPIYMLIVIFGYALTFFYVVIAMAHLIPWAPQNL